MFDWGGDGHDAEWLLLATLTALAGLPLRELDEVGVSSRYFVFELSTGGMVNGRYK